MRIDTIKPSRRAFLAGTAGIMVGFYLAPMGRAAAAPATGVAAGRPAG